MSQIDSDRIEKAKVVLQESDLGCLVCFLAENILLLSGYWPRNGFACLVFPTNGKSVLIAPESEEDLALGSWVDDVRTFSWGLKYSGDPFENMSNLLKQTVSDLGLSGHPTGFEGSFEFVAPPFWSSEPATVSGIKLNMLQETFGGNLIDATDMIHDLRLKKTDGEITKLRTAHEITRFGLEAFIDNVFPGRSEIEIAASVEAAILINGTGYKNVDIVRAWACVMSGENAARAYRPFLPSTNRIVKEGEMALLELAVVADGWWTDLTRTRVAGKASSQDRDRWQIILDAQLAACDAIKPGMPENLIDKAAREIIDEHGLGEYFVHHTGHGVGLRYHEPKPFIHPDATMLLEPGMLTTIEPGIYIDGWGGMRCEDNVLVTSSGREILSEFPRKLEG